MVDQISKERKQHLENIEKLTIHDIREMVSDQNSANYDFRKNLITFLDLEQSRSSREKLNTIKVGRDQETKTNSSARFLL